MKLKDIKPNPNNPRVLRDEKFLKLKQSIQEFPKMLSLRPIVIDENKLQIMGDIMYLYYMERKIENYSRYVFTDCGKVLSITSKGKKEILGAKDKNGYLKITLIRDDKKIFYYRKHRLIMWAFNGISNLQVNHIDGDILNNNLKNLEYVNAMENQSHRRKKAGYHVGVCWGKKENKWRAYIQKDKKWFHLGFYNDFNDAKQAYLNKLNELNLINKYA